jgi:hypothetical protein
VSGLRRTFALLVGGIAAGVLAQAVLAGLFLSGAGGARVPHIVVGWLLPYVAVVPAILGIVLRSGSELSLTTTIAAAVLPVVLFVQEVLGHLPAAATTAIHVPLGVVLFGWSLLLTIAAVRGGPGAEVG